MSEGPTDGKRIKATRTAFDIIETVAEGGRPNTSEIAEQTGYSRSTVHYHLQTLREDGYVIREEGGFRLGLRTSRLGRFAREQHALAGLVEKPVEDLAVESDALAQIAVIEGGTVTTLYTAGEADLEEQPFATGTTLPGHATAYGQALLAFRSENAEAVVGEELSAYTAETITDLDALLDRLETTRELGFAYSIGEYVGGATSVAAPIADGSTGEVVGAVGITDDHDAVGDPQRHIKARRFSDELPGAVQRTAQIIAGNVADAD